MGLRTRFAVGVVLLLSIASCGGEAFHIELPAGVAAFDPRNFADSANITNPWLPWTPGSRWVYQGNVRGIPQTVETFVTNNTKLIDGVMAREVHDKDIDAGQLVEETLDYYAQDKQGNVWYMGELTTHYVNGMLTDPLPADDTPEARDRRRFLAAVARGVIKHLKDNPDALQVVFTQVASPHNTSQFEAHVQLNVSDIP